MKVVTNGAVVCGGLPAFEGKNVMVLGLKYDGKSVTVQSLSNLWPGVRATHINE